MSSKKERSIGSQIDRLFSWLLARKERRTEAVSRLLRFPSQLQGKPPKELMLALKRFEATSDEPTLLLAQAWEREPLFDELFQMFMEIRHPAMRLSLASKLGKLPSLHSWQKLVKIADDPHYYTVAIRIYMLEALAILVNEKKLSWNDLLPLINNNKNYPNPRLRVAIAKLLLAFEWEKSEEFLFSFLDDDNVWVIIELLTILPTKKGYSSRFLGKISDLKKHQHPALSRAASQFEELYQKEVLFIEQENS